VPAAEAQASVDSAGQALILATSGIYFQTYSVLAAQSAETGRYAAAIYIYIFQFPLKKQQWAAKR